MRWVPVRFALMVALVFVVAGCASRNKGKLEGTRWSSEAISMWNVPQAASLPDGAVQLEFRENHDFIYYIPQGIFRGKYRYGPSDIVIFELDQELAGSKVHYQTIRIKENKLTLVDSDGTTLEFRKIG